MQFKWHCLEQKKFNFESLELMHGRKKEFFRARLLPGQEQVQLLEPLVYPPVKYEQLLQRLL